MFHPTSFVAPLLGVLAVGYDRSESSSHGRVPLVVVLFGRKKLLYGGEVGFSVLEGRVGGRHVSPSPSPDSLVNQSGHYNRRVSIEVELPALVSGDYRSRGNGPVETVECAHQSRGRPIDHTPWFNSRSDLGASFVKARLEVLAGEPLVPDGLGPMLDNVRVGWVRWVSLTFPAAVSYHESHLELLASKAAFGRGCGACEPSLVPEHGRGDTDGLVAMHECGHSSSS